MAQDVARNAACLAAFLGAFMASQRIAPAMRAPAAAGFTQPTEADIRAALPSELLVQGARRDDDIRLRLIAKAEARADVFQLLHQEFDDARQAAAAAAASRLLGGRSYAGFRARYTLGDHAVDRFVRIRREPGATSGFVAKQFYTAQFPLNLSYGFSGDGCNDMFHFRESIGGLLLDSIGPSSVNGERHQRLEVELPLKEGARVGGRIFGWSSDREDYEVIGSVTWERLEEAEWDAHVRRWKAEAGASAQHNGGWACLENAALTFPPRDF